uniref:shufflon system plasmid conjugative transfer pilus tip adhesin PilV n=1 Tax=Cupriavidus gilardii TaxID=82541 RepID=UPI00247A4BA7|nr:shufflon system plasmid conjugative transfer pilus tip adhesin PilV [Cupriavidus gilardii]WDE72706.1 hypothetical protein [Cupriavidus gilardii]
MKLNRRPPRTQPIGRKQDGFASLITLTLILAVATLLQVQLGQERARYAAETIGRSVGGAMRDLNNVMGTYAAKYWDALQLGTSIAGVANPMEPTVAELQALGLTHAAFSSTSPVGGTFRTRVVRLPANCVGTDCNLATRVWIDQPMLNVNGRPDGRRLIAAVGVIGADGGFTEGNTATVRFSGGWTSENPDPAQRAGILVAVNGYGSSAWGAFVRIRDTRDPDLRGRLTVAGDTQVNSNLNVAQTATANRLVGNDVIPNSNLYLPAAVSPGTPCSVDASVRRNSATWSGLVVCAFGKWQPIGLAVDNIAEWGWCGTEGQIGTNVANQGFLCRGGMWRSLTTSVGKVVTNRKIDNVVDGMAFAKDSCPGGTPWALYTPKQHMVNVTGNVMPPIQGVYFWMNDAGGSWVAQASAVSPAAWYSGNDVGAIGGQLVGTVTTGCSF